MQKPLNGNDQAMGDADLHRLVKEMIKAEISDKSSELYFAKAVASILLKDV